MHHHDKTPETNAKGRELADNQILHESEAPLALPTPKLGRSVRAHTLRLRGSEEQEGAARGHRDDGDGDGHRGLDALPLQEVHGRGLSLQPRTRLTISGRVWLGTVGARGNLEVAGGGLVGGVAAREGEGREVGEGGAAEIARFFVLTVLPSPKLRKEEVLKRDAHGQNK